MITLGYTAVQMKQIINLIRYIFKHDAHGIVSQAGHKELQKQALIRMMQEDEKLGLYKTRELYMLDEQELKQYEYASELGTCDNKEERLKMIERVEVLVRYRGAVAQQILVHKEDAGLLKAMKHLYEHYNNQIKENLGL
jgi:hypothetical protein